MTEQVGQVRAIFRYPVKSMAGHAIDHAEVGWHGLTNDRRFAFRRVGSQEGFPFVTAGRMPRLVLYRPEGTSATGAPTQVLTPEGQRFELWSDELGAELSDQFGSRLELSHLKHGIFDEASISIITSGTVKALEHEARRTLDLRRFRPNLLIDATDEKALIEDAWVGKTLTLGSMDGPAVAITMRDVRCSMMNLDPETGASDPAVLKAAVRLNENTAGVYGTVTRIGDVSIGDPVFISD
jgi:uncharacterized protein